MFVSESVRLAFPKETRLIGQEVLVDDTPIQRSRVTVVDRVVKRHFPTFIWCLWNRIFFISTTPALGNIGHSSAMTGLILSTVWAC